MRFYLTLTNAKSMTNKVLRGLREWKGKLDIIIDRHRGGDNRQKGPSAKADVWVTLEEMYSGTSRDMNIARNVYCPKCRGTGAKDGKTKTCPKCNGQRVVMQNVQVGFGMQMQMQMACDRCQGRGQITAQNCPHCQGRKVVND